MYVYVPCAYDTHEGKKEVFFQMLVRHHVFAGDWPWVLCNNSESP